jgi:hypothetical protein
MNCDSLCRLAVAVVFLSHRGLIAAYRTTENRLGQPPPLATAKAPTPTTENIAAQRQNC